MTRNTAVIRPLIFLSLLILSSGLLAQSAPPDATFPPPDNLVAQGVPPIPASLVDQVGRYTDFRSAVFVDWHPTRREMLINTRFADTAQVHLVKMPGGARTQLTF